MTEDRGTSERSVIQGFIATWKILRNRKNAGLAVELDLVCGIRVCLNLARLGPNPGDDVPKRPPLLKLRDHQRSILRVFPDPKFPNSTSDHFGARIAVPALKCGIHIDKSTFVNCRNG